MPKTFCNVCPADCAASCRMLTEVHNGRIVSIKGDPRDAYTKGALCAKGYAYLERIYAPDRVLYPLKQRKKGSAEWDRVSWDEALGAIAEKLIAVEEEYGNLLPVCLDKYLGTTGILSHSVGSFFHSLGATTSMIGTPCIAAGIDAMTLHYGKSLKPVPEDMLNARLIILWGSNAAWTFPHQMRYVFDAQDRGAKIVVIDPILTATAARSDLYFQIRPDTDGILALGLGKVLLDKDLLDHRFLEHYTYGWPEYRDVLAAVDLEEVSSITGIPPEDICELAISYGISKPATIWVGLGLQRTVSGGQNVRAIDSLAALTGNIGKPGGNVHFASYEALLYGGECLRSQLPPRVVSLTPPRETRNRLLGTGRFAEVKTLDPPLELMWIAGRNPVAQDPDSHTVRDVLRKIPMVVVADQFLTATAQLADYFLPVASPFEFEDVVISYWHYGAALNEQAIAPLGECKSDFEIMRQLAATLNQLKPGFTSFPTGMEATAWLDRELWPQLYAITGITHYHELRNRYTRINLPCVPWQDYRFLTPSGKYEFWSNLAQQNTIPPLPAPFAPPPNSQAYPLRLMTVHNYITHNSQLYNIKGLRHMEKTSKLYLHPDTARQKNLQHGDRVRVYNPLGEIELFAVPSVSVPQDVVMAFLGATDNRHEVLNTLLRFCETDLGQIATGCNGLSFTNCYVNVVKVE